MLDIIFFDPEASDYDTIERTCELLKLEEDEATLRLKKAQLIERN